jgi:hypothetical protein
MRQGSIETELGFGVTLAEIEAAIAISEGEQ